MNAGPRTLLVSAAGDELWRRTDRGIDWITDRYSLVRADLLRDPPTANAADPAAFRPCVLRTVLAEFRDLLEGDVREVGTWTAPSWVAKPPPAVVLSVASLMVAVQRKPWKAWQRLGAIPRFTRRGWLSLWTPIRGRDALAGGLLPLSTHTERKDLRLVIGGAR